MRTLTILMVLGLGTTGLSRTAIASPNAGSLAVQSAGFSKEDLKKLLEAKVSDETIIAFIKKNPSGPDISTKDLLELRSAGASDAVLVALIQASSSAAPVPANPPPVPARSGEALLPSDGTYSGVPDYSYGDYYPYYYSPFWYYPAGISLGFGFRFRDGDRFHHFNHFDRFQNGPRGPAVGSHGTFHGTGGFGGGHGGGGHR
jgi:hypothetical protein